MNMLTSLIVQKVLDTFLGTGTGTCMYKKDKRIRFAKELREGGFIHDKELDFTQSEKHSFNLFLLLLVYKSL
jgi:hypothetical protein